MRQKRPQRMSKLFINEPLVVFNPAKSSVTWYAFFLKVLKQGAKQINCELHDWRQIGQISGTLNLARYRNIYEQSERI
ncbi:hypothetical protein SAMN05421881_100750 [Nitrosomonas halophila]|uniref:Uncharacterized protein n=1 Tax=Nitrosomonas halophila TaxID=44576 RepID=A0A1H3E8M5_9PROT|nr:hypothetical protein SAMN05421881_100750 [Nitrosomonas halophila]